MAMTGEIHSSPHPANPRLWRVAQALGLLGLALLGVFLPSSTAGTSLGLVALFLSAALLLPSLWALRVWREPFVGLGLLLFAYIGLHSLWMSWAQAQPVSLLGSYSELWRVPVLLAVFALARNTEVFWRALVMGAIALCGLYWLNLAGLTVIDSNVFHLEGRRISAPLGLLAVGWIALERSVTSARPWAMRSVALLMAMTTIFAIEGRTGHFSLIALSALAGWLYFQGRWRWLGMLLLPLAVALLSINSKAVQNRMDDTLTITQKKTDSTEVRSAELRKAFYTTGLQIVLDHPWMGVGYDGVAAAYETRIIRRVAAGEFSPPYAQQPYSRPPNLHNEYLMQWAGGGLSALILLIGWMVSPLLSKGHSPSTRRVLAGLILLFGLGCLFNSWLLDFTPGHVFTVLIAWQLSGRYRQQHAATHPGKSA
jgi:O-antigen ligase